MEEKDLIGIYIQPAGKDGLEIPTMFYGIRDNKELAFMSSKPLGLQVQIEAFGEMVWINIQKSWIQSTINVEDIMSNANCNKICKHNAYCSLNLVDTNNCTNSDVELDIVFGESESLIFGKTSKQISAMQGHPERDLKK